MSLDAPCCMMAVFGGTMCATCVFGSSSIWQARAHRSVLAMLVIEMFLEEADEHAGLGGAFAPSSLYVQGWLPGESLR